MFYYVRTNVLTGTYSLLFIALTHFEASDAFIEGHFSIYPFSGNLPGKCVCSAFSFHISIYETLTFYFFTFTSLFQLDTQICHSHLSLHCRIWDGFPYGCHCMLLIFCLMALSHGLRTMVAAGPAHLQAGARKPNLTLNSQPRSSSPCVRGAPQTLQQHFPGVGNCSKEKQAKVRS